ncbi:MAG: hypothetical protein V3T70_01920 [Phycisphaerae bacterium]
MNRSEQDASDHRNEFAGQPREWLRLVARVRSAAMVATAIHLSELSEPRRADQSPAESGDCCAPPVRLFDIPPDAEACA